MPLRPVLRGNVFHAFGTVAGERVRQSLGTGDEARAEELCAHLEARLWKRRVYGEEAIRTFDEAALSYLAAGGERRFLTPVLRYFRGRLLGTIKAGEIRAAAQALFPNGAPATRNRHVIVPARAVILHAADLGWCPPIKVKAFPVEKPKRVAVDREWVDAFMAQAEKDKLPHVAAVLLFMFQTGARVSEAARLLPSDLDLAAGTATLRKTKTGGNEVRHLPNELIVRLANLPMHDRFPVFRYADRYGIRNAMKRVCARAGLPFVPPHQAGRHSFATQALALGAGLKEVMEAGGWKSARMVLEIYAHASEGSRQVAARFNDSRTGVKGSSHSAKAK